MRRKVLVVDDEPELLDFFVQGLTGRGFDVVTATTGKGALELTESEHPDVITLDLNLPDMSGTEVFKALKNNELTKDIPVIMITGNTSGNEMVKHFDMGIENYLTKPITSKEIATYIEGILVSRAEEETGE